MSKRTKALVGAMGAVCVLAGCGGAVESAEPAAPLAPDLDLAQQAVYTDHAIVTCQSATMYGNSTPANPIRTLYSGNKVGIRQDGGTASWGLILDYGAGDWGFVLRSCMTRCSGVNSPVAGCF